MSAAIAVLNFMASMSLDTFLMALWMACSFSAEQLPPSFSFNFLHDIGVIPHAEPYAKRTSHGMILGRKQEGKLVFGQGYPAALVAPYHGDRFAPVEGMEGQTFQLG